MGSNYIEYVSLTLPKPIIVILYEYFCYLIKYIFCLSAVDVVSWVLLQLVEKNSDFLFIFSDLFIIQ